MKKLIAGVLSSLLILTVCIPSVMADTSPVSAGDQPVLVAAAETAPAATSGAAGAAGTTGTAGAAAGMSSAAIAGAVIAAAVLVGVVVAVSNDDDDPVAHTGHGH